MGFDLVVTSGEGDVTKQIQAMENLINDGVDAISINFIDAAAFGPTMAKAKAANIPVICLHSKIEGCAATLGFDERYTGKIVGEYAAELLKKRYNGEVKGEVANLQGLLGQGLNTDRSGGFTDVMAQYPGVKVVAQEPTNWDPTKAVSITENWMTAYPKLDLIYGNSDSLTVPAANVVERAGKQDQVLIVSVDGTEPGLEAVKSGAMESTVLLAPQYSGFWKAYFPFQVATKKRPGDRVPDQGRAGHQGQCRRGAEARQGPGGRHPEIPVREAAGRHRRDLQVTMRGRWAGPPRSARRFPPRRARCSKSPASPSASPAWWRSTRCR